MNDWRSALADRYRIERELGAGGMATVYLAQDLRHDRKVAIKVLKPELAAVLGGERFVVEIKTTAALQHPHILPLFDSGETDGQLYYVMPYIRGETIREKLNRETQFGVDDAIRIAREVADALDYAHRHGVIHRDIKPENVLLHDGRAMVMDFGIALAVSAAAGGRMTETGLSLGTPHYMSPEQATAEKEITARSDVYSLASVLYEMLTGDPPFTASSAQAVIMKIITETAQPVSVRRKTVPPNVAAALAKALEKLPADRFESAKAFGDALINPSFSVDQTNVGLPRHRARRSVSMSVFAAVTAIAVISTGIAAWSRLRTSPVTRTPTARFTLELPDSQAVLPIGQTIVVSPDGSEILYGGRGRNGNVLFRRRLDEMTVSEVPGSDNPQIVTYSPDGRTLALTTTKRELIALPLPAGAPIHIADDVGRFSWGDNGVIVFWRGSSLWRTDPRGQKVTRLTIADSMNGGVHTWPHVLPGGEAVLFTSLKENGSAPRVQVVRVRDGAVTPLDLDGLSPRYVPTGHILVSRTDGTVLAAPFDLRTLELRGTPVSVLEGLAVVPNGAAMYSVSQNGTLAYLEGDADLRPVIVDRTGREQTLNFPPGRYAHPRLSPSGDRVVVERTENGQSDIWILARETGQLLRLTRDGVNGSPEWSADGRRVGWIRSAGGGQTLVWQRADGSGSPEQISVRSRVPFHFQFMPDGKQIVAVIGSAFRHDIALIPIDGSAAPRMLADSPADELMPNVSPDGRWMAYTSTETGRTEAYVVKIDDPSTRLQLTTDGGGGPAWTNDGRAVIAFAGGRLASISLAFTPRLEVTRRETSAAFPYRAGGNADRDYDTRAATSELAVLARASSKRERIVVVTGWLDELRRRMAQAARP